MRSYIFEIYTEDQQLYELYSNKLNHPDDSGCDLYIPSDVTFDEKETKLVDLKVIVKLIDLETEETVPFLIIPRSSIYKLPIRMSNNIGLIDRGYNGTLKSPLDNLSTNKYTINNGQRLFQLITPDLSYNFKIKVFNTLTLDPKYYSKRGERGFGSTG